MEVTRTIVIERGIIIKAYVRRGRGRKEGRGKNGMIAKEEGNEFFFPPLLLLPLSYPHYKIFKSHLTYSV
jgi:hypothetical protein